MHQLPHTIKSAFDLPRKNLYSILSLTPESLGSTYRIPHELGAQYGAPLNSYYGDRVEINSMFTSGICGLSSHVLKRCLTLH